MHNTAPVPPPPPAPLPPYLNLPSPPSSPRSPPSPRPRARHSLAAAPSRQHRPLTPVSPFSAPAQAAAAAAAAKAVPRSSSFTRHRRFLTGEGLSAREALGKLDSAPQSGSSTIDRFAEMRHVVGQALIIAPPTANPLRPPPPPPPPVSLSADTIIHAHADMAADNAAAPPPPAPPLVPRVAMRPARTALHRPPDQHVHVGGSVDVDDVDDDDDDDDDDMLMPGDTTGDVEPRAQSVPTTDALSTSADMHDPPGSSEDTASAGSRDRVDDDDDVGGGVAVPRALAEDADDAKSQSDTSMPSCLPPIVDAQHAQQHSLGALHLSHLKLNRAVNAHSFFADPSDSPFLAPAARARLRETTHSLPLPAAPVVDTAAKPAAPTLASEGPVDAVAPPPPHTMDDAVLLHVPDVVQEEEAPTHQHGPESPLLPRRPERDVVPLGVPLSVPPPPEAPILSVDSAPSNVTVDAALDEEEQHKRNTAASKPDGPIRKSRSALHQRLRNAGADLVSRARRIPRGASLPRMRGHRGVAATRAQHPSPDPDSDAEAEDIERDVIVKGPDTDDAKDTDEFPRRKSRASSRVGRRRRSSRRRQSRAASRNASRANTPGRDNSPVTRRRTDVFSMASTRRAQAGVRRAAEAVRSPSIRRSTDAVMVHLPVASPRTPPSASPPPPSVSRRRADTLRKTSPSPPSSPLRRQEDTSRTASPGPPSPQLQSLGQRSRRQTDAARASASGIRPRRMTDAVRPASPSPPPRGVRGRAASVSQPPPSPGATNTSSGLNDVPMEDQQDMPEFVTIRRIIRRVRGDGSVQMVTRNVRVKPERVLPNGDVVVRRTMRRTKDDGSGTEILTVLQVIPRRRPNAPSAGNVDGASEHSRGGSSGGIGGVVVSNGSIGGSKSRAESKDCGSIADPADEDDDDEASSMPELSMQLTSRGETGTLAVRPPNERMLPGGQRRSSTRSRTDLNGDEQEVMERATHRGGGFARKFGFSEDRRRPTQANRSPNEQQQRPRWRRAHLPRVLSFHNRRKRAADSECGSIGTSPSTGTMGTLGSVATSPS